MHQHMSATADADVQSRRNQRPSVAAARITARKRVLAVDYCDGSA